MVIPRFTDIIRSYGFRKALGEAGRKSAEDGIYDSLFFGSETDFNVVSYQEDGFRVGDVSKGMYERTFHFGIPKTLVFTHFHPPHTTNMPSYSDLKNMNSTRKKTQQEGVNPIYIVGLVTAKRFDLLNTEMELRIFQEASDVPLNLTQLGVEQQLKRLDEEENPDFFDGIAIGTVGHVPHRLGFNPMLARQLPNYQDVRDAYSTIETAFLNSLGNRELYRTETIRFSPGFPGSVVEEDMAKLERFELEQKPVLRLKDTKRPEDILEETNALAGKWRELESVLEKGIRGK